MKKLTLSFLFLIFFSLIFACRKKTECPNQVLPDKSAINSVGFMINGKVWRESPAAWYEVAVDAQYYNGVLGKKWLTISATRDIENPCDTINDQFVIFIKNLRKGEIKPFPLATLTQWKDKIGKDHDYKVDSTRSNKLEITELDTVNRNLKATFECYLYGVNKFDTLKISSGKIAVFW